MEKQHIIDNEKITTTITIANDGKSFKVIYRQKDGVGLNAVQYVNSSLHEYSTKGGTSLYCPSCKRITKCEVWASPENRNLYRVKHSDIQWFHRYRMCRTCFYHFVTAEIQADFLNELVNLRDAIASGKLVSSQDLLSYGDNILLFRKE